MLEITGLKKSFGGLQALKGIDLKLPDRSILGVIGMNGSGKTTMLNCINGLYAATAGSIRLDGTELVRREPHAIARLGIGRTFQVPKLFSRLSLIENLEVPLGHHRLEGREIHARIDEWLGRVQLHPLRHNHAEELSGGQQKLLELARIMVTRPKVILLDEPFAGVNPALALLLIDIIRTIPLQHGCAVMLVSHDLTSIYKLSNHIVVLNEGQILCEGNADRIRNDPAVVEAYLGA
jgi:branched-chain amino acid transport system ATP-binding protein